MGYCSATVSQICSGDTYDVKFTKYISDIKSAQCCYLLQKRPAIVSNFFKFFIRRWCTRIKPADIYLLKFNNKNIKTRSKICSKLLIKTLEWRLMLTLNISLSAGIRLLSFLMVISILMPLKGLPCSTNFQVTALG